LRDRGAALLRDRLQLVHLDPLLAPTDLRLLEIDAPDAP